MGLPIAGHKQAHRPPGRPAPGRATAVPSPHGHFPKTLHPRLQGFAGVSDKGGLLGGHPAAVPKIALVGGQPFGRRRHQHAIGGLALAPFGRAKLPPEPRLLGLDA